MASIYDFTAERIDGEPVALSAYRGRVLLIVNTASRCGFTPHYAGLETLHERLEADGLSVLAFPCNQFGRQEPGDAREIETFCRVAYRITFPVFAKVEVSGPDAHPLFAYLQTQKPGPFGTRAIRWNFTKFLVGRDGTVHRRFPSRIRPAAIEPHIRLLL